jgi:hypothetical protein
MSRSLVFMTFAAAALMLDAAFAHHSRAPYDMTKEVVFVGSVTQLDWKNPHILLTLETRGADGAVTVQEIEASAVSQMRVLGLPREALEPGSQITVRARPSRRGVGARAFGIDVKTAAGAVYPLNIDGGVSIAASVPAQTLAGQWLPTVESAFEIFSSFPKSMLLTEAGRAAREDTIRRMQTPGDTVGGICEPAPLLPLTVGFASRTIEIGNDTIVMNVEGEGIDQQRIVHLNQAEHPAGTTPSLLGHSIGRWEGETLVIDTIALTRHPLGIIQLPSTASTHVVERLSLSDDRQRLEYTFTVADPAYLTGPASHTVRWDHRLDLTLSNEPCDPENARHALE